jgi:hypothetical protein
MLAAGRVTAMQSTTALIVIITLVIGGFAGWNFRTFRGASADLKVHKNRIPGFRQVRRRTGLITVSLVVLTLLALRDLLRK